MAWHGGIAHEPGRHPRPRHAAGGQGRARGGGAARPAAPGHAPEPTHAGYPRRQSVGCRARRHDLVIWVSILGVAPFTLLMPYVGLAATGALSVIIGFVLARSEEHTSELQSLMRISYAVFCLKKKNKQA